MYHRHAIRDQDRERINDLLPGRPGQPGVTAQDNRLFVDAVLWSAKTGAPWRDLPERCGKWNTVWKRFARWARSGVWKTVFDILQDPDLEWLILDATIVRPHQHAAGARKGADGQGEQALGRRRGGFGTKIHAAVSSLMLPVVLLLTAGLPRPRSRRSSPTRGTTARPWWRRCKRVGRRRCFQRCAPGSNSALDQERYQDRNLAERFWDQVKQFRRVATHYEQTARDFLAFVQVASIMVLLR